MEQKKKRLTLDLGFGKVRRNSGQATMANIFDDIEFSLGRHPVLQEKT